MISSFASRLCTLLALTSFIACKPVYVVPDRRLSGGNTSDDESSQTTAAAFSFAAGEAQYASLRETVTLKADNPGKVVISVDWGDGTKTSEAADEFKHSYDRAGNYTVKASSNGEMKEWTLEIGALLALSEAVEELYATDKVWIMAHRSHTSDTRIPENSLSAVRAAIAAGADVIETDTHRTRDGQIVISHDASIDKHMNGKGKIAEMTLSSIRQYKLTDREGNVTDETMPTLEEFLKEARGKAYVNLDYSPRTASTNEVLNVVEKLGMVQQVFMYCESASFVKQVFARNPEANAYVKSEDYASLLDGANRYFLQVGWNSGQTQSSECVLRCRNAYNQGVLCSVNLLHVNHDYIPEYKIDQSQLQSLFALYPECQMVQTDCPRELSLILSEQGRR